MEEVQREGFRTRVRTILAEISIEPILFLYYIGLFARMVVRENLKLDRFCRISLGYDAIDCANLNDGQHEQMQVETQKLDSVFIFYEKIASTIIPILLMSFLASWSDRSGRKALLVLCFFGDALYNVVYLLESLFTSWPPEVLLLASFLQSIGGGIMMLIMAAYSFMADKTSQGSRTIRMTVMNVVMHLGSPLGTALGAWIFAIKGFAWVFGLTLAISLTCLLLVILVLKEKKPEPQEEGSQRRRSPWDPRNVLDLFRACLRRRPGRDRLHLVLVITFMLGYTSTPPHNLYLWCRRVFLWDENQYSLYSTVSQITEQVTSLIMIPIMYRLALHECTAAAGTIFLMFLKALSLGLTTSPSQWWVLYAFVIIPSGLPPPAIRGLLSKICDKGEVGRIFSMLSILEIVWPVADSALFSLIYTSTLDSYPSFEHLVTAAFAAYPLCGFLLLRLSLEQQKLSTDHENLELEDSFEKEK